MTRALSRGLQLGAALLCFGTSAAAQHSEPPAARGTSERHRPAVPPGQQVVSGSGYAPFFAPQSPGRDAPVAEASESSWYGWQTLAVDAVAMTAFVYGIERGAGDVFTSDRGGEAFAYAGFGGYLLGGPVLHLIHERPGAALGSFGLRAAAPLVGMYAGTAMAGCDRGSGNAGGDLCGMEEAGIGLMIGAGAAIALDAALLARKETRSSDHRPRPSAQRPRLSPGVVVTAERRALVLAGSF